MGSVRRRGGTVRIKLDRAEASLIVALVSEVSSLLAGESSPDVDGSADPLAALVGELDASATAPDDPILSRLLPEAYRDDPSAAGEFRRLTAGDLRATKRAALQRIRDDIMRAGDRDAAQAEAGKDLKLELDEDAAVSWLHGLTDVRLALGVQLDVTDETFADRHAVANDPELAIYDWLTWLQDAIVNAVSD